MWVLWPSTCLCIKTHFTRALKVLVKHQSSIFAYEAACSLSGRRSAATDSRADNPEEYTTPFMGRNKKFHFIQFCLNLLEELCPELVNFGKISR